MGTCVFIFTRDLRIEDNTGLNYCAKNFDKIIPIFIITKAQIGDNNEYKSERSVDFMKKSLQKLLKETSNKLNILYSIKQGEDIIKDIIKEQKIDAIIINKDYSPFSLKRENMIKEIAETSNIEFKKTDDYLLNDNFIMNNSGKHYKKFTPFYNKLLKNKIRSPYTEKNIITKMVKLNKVNQIQKIKPKENSDLNPENLDLINKYKEFIKNYKKQRDKMYIDTTRLSVYLKYGIVSVREIYKLTQKYPEFIRSLIWRDFYYTYYYHSPDALKTGDANQTIKWKSDKENLKKWKNGKTGFPIVDAAMRQLNSIGFMHNRGRMIVASFLSKDLLIDWKEGEKYFSNKLLDIDWVINTANWQNVVSVAKHSQPYFRVFNPWQQSIKYDPDCKYIKKWIPELKDIQSDHIHKWYKYNTQYNTYIQPIINHQERKQNYLKSFK